jgi:hypothetical protein
MSDSDNLGKVSPWQIREFPESLRDDIVKQAKAERVSVSEFVTGHMAALRDAGWNRADVSNRAQTVNQTRKTDPMALLAAATAVAATGVKVEGLAGWTADLIREARGLPPLTRTPPPRRLTNGQTVTAALIQPQSAEP